MENDIPVNHLDLYVKLHQEYRLLHLLYHRNKNQHRVAQWWKRLNMLKRNCGQVVELLQNKKFKNDREFVKLYHLVNRFTKRQISKSYYDFNGVIALGQFVTLGVVLVGLLSRIYAIYREILELYATKFESVGCLTRSRVQDPQQSSQAEQHLEKLLESISKEELGEEISQAIGTSHETSVTVPSSEVMVAPSESEFDKEKKKRTKKRKKPKSAIDGIFG